MSNVCATKEYDPMKVAIRCKYCGKPEYYGEFRWISGHMLCRDCYKADYEDRYKTHYSWDDLDGKRPTEDELID